MGISATPAKIIDAKLNSRIGKTIKTLVNNRGWKPSREQMRDAGDFEVTCKSCKEKIATGKYWRKGDPKVHYWNIVYLSRLDRVKNLKKEVIEWFGCYCLNIHPKTHELRCECCCGNSWKKGEGIIDTGIDKGFEFKKIN
jgi:hypothetical protein